MTIDLGSRLRYIRTLHNLSQRELAKRVGVTNSTISLIESNTSNPSVGALKRILDGASSSWRRGGLREQRGWGMRPA